MASYICVEFIRDLIEQGDAHFAARVLSKILSAAGEFEHDADDHRYSGIDGCWIRYVSRQNTAYRAIFIKRGADVYWYRAGGHSVEDRLRAPTDLSSAVKVEQQLAGVDMLVSHKYPRYLKSQDSRLIREVLASRILIPHKAITLVTPRLSANLFGPLGLVGRLIDSVLSGGGSVTVLTKPPLERELSSYRWLVNRGVDLLLHSSLNTRLLVFEVDRERLDSEMTHVQSIGIVGSSELTEEGIGEANPDSVKEELCYVIESDDLDGSSDYLLTLVDKSVSLEAHVQGY